MKTLFTALAILTIITLLAPSANAHHADTLLIINPDDRLVTGMYDFGNNTLVSTDVRVLEGEFDAFGTIDAPGFNALSSGNVQLPAGFSALPGDAAAGFTGKAFAIGMQTSNLWFWDATGPVVFSPVTDGTILNVSKAPAVVFSADFDSSVNDVVGFTIATTASDGFLHKHIDFSIIDAATAAPGFYLWSFEIGVGSYTADPIFFVHGLGDHDEALHEQAIEFVEFNLVPEPASLILTASGLLGLLMRRR